MDEFPLHILEGLKALECYRKSSVEELKNSLDPELKDWRDDPATRRQISYIYVLAKNNNRTADDIELEYGDFHHMTKGEIQSLIESLGGGKVQKRKTTFRQSPNFGTQRNLIDILEDDSDVPF